MFLPQNPPYLPPENMSDSPYFATFMCQPAKILPSLKVNPHRTLETLASNILTSVVSIGVVQKSFKKNFKF